MSSPGETEVKRKVADMDVSSLTCKDIRFVHGRIVCQWLLLSIQMVGGQVAEAGARGIGPNAAQQYIANG